jgi:chromosome segregation ATPase
MRSTNMVLQIAALALVGAVSGIFGPAITRGQDTSTQQNPDPMAEAARKARAEQQAAGKPKKIYTNDDIPSAPAASSKSADGKDVAATGDTAAKDDKDTAEENDPKKEAYWKKRFAKARAKLADAEKEVDVLQRELDKNQVQYYPNPQTALMQQYTRKDIDDNLAQLDAKKKQVEALKQQIGDLEDELRKSGGDPGWAR